MALAKDLEEFLGLFCFLEFCFLLRRAGAVWIFVWIFHGLSYPPVILANTSGNLPAPGHCVKPGSGLDLGEGDPRGYRRPFVAWEPWRQVGNLKLKISTRD